VFLCTRRSIALLEVSAEYRELGVPHVRPTQWANVGFFVFLQMPKNLVRRYGDGDLHFVTFSCYRRLALLGTERARNVFVRALGEVRKKYAIQLVGYVVMPEHVHLLIGESKLGMPSTVVQSLKLQVSKRMRRRIREKPSSQKMLPFLQDETELPQFWQKRFYDFNVYSAAKQREKLDYMHRNPVTRGLVKDPKDWVWSSYASYSGMGSALVEIDFVT
jgi:putative transposase